MLEAVLTKRNVSFKTKITVKSLVSAGLIICAVLLPQLVHLIGGAPGGVQWLPMYLPVLVAGCLLGTYWGLSVGILSPIASFLITLAFGNPMPALARLPFMIAELAMFAAISGLFGKKIAENRWMAFPAVLIAQVSGRAFFMLLVAIFQGVSELSVPMVWSQIQTGFIGLILQALIVPFIIMGLFALLDKQKE